MTDRPEPEPHEPSPASELLSARAALLVAAHEDALHNKKYGLVPRLTRVEDTMASLDRKAPPKVATWTVVGCAVVMAVQSLLDMVAR